jgi:peptidoglycan hydrolase-like protein with peptidoglycan-binding domain
MPLQKLLKDIDLYDYKIDGIAGAILINGITRFQRQNQLMATGFPDPETLFLLNNIQKKGEE